tara:strand:+ start:3272 stop:4030 length:759 start_codon:yes stop_codon:yes gene_type:complete
MSEVIPIFKTDNSFGKSVLTDRNPDETKEGGPKSVFSIAKNKGLKTLFLLEDSMMGFFYCHKTAKDLGIKLVYGVYFKIEDSRNEKHDSKVVILSKNDEGHKDLMKLYSECETELGGKISFEKIKERIGSNKNVQICIPFYDSFIHWNLMNLDGISVNLTGLDVVFFRDEKGLPFDSLIQNNIEKYCKKNNFKIQDVHSIYYETDEEAKELQVLKILTTRKFGRPPNLGNPNLEHFASNKFSWESYERKNGK